MSSLQCCIFDDKIAISKINTKEKIRFATKVYLRLDITATLHCCKRGGDSPSCYCDGFGPVCNQLLLCLP